MKKQQENSNTQAASLLYVPKSWSPWVYTKMFKFIQKLNKSHINYNSDSRGRSGYSRSSAEFRVFSWLLLAPRKLQACTLLPVINLKVFSLFPFVHFYCLQLLSQDAYMNLGYRCFRRGLDQLCLPWIN